MVKTHTHILPVIEPCFPKQQNTTSSLKFLLPHGVSSEYTLQNMISVRIQVSLIRWCTFAWASAPAAPVLPESPHRTRFSDPAVLIDQRERELSESLAEEKSEST